MNLTTNAQRDAAGIVHGFHGPDNCENVDCNATAIYIDTLSDLYLCIRHADERAFEILTANAR